MTAAASGETLDLDTLRHGVEDRDINALLSLYADDAVISIVDQRHTPSHPQLLHGHHQIRAFLSGVLSGKTTHRLEHVIAGVGGVSYVERCEYPDGSQVLASAFLSIADGHIVRHEEVQAWDSGEMRPGYRGFTRPDEVRTFEKGRLELIRTPSGNVGRLVLAPGWRWSRHVRPVAGTSLCQASHVSYQISGRLRLQFADGTTFDAEPGQFGTVPPGHDAWVIGDEPAILLDWAGVTDYARP